MYYTFATHRHIEVQQGRQCLDYKCWLLPMVARKACDATSAGWLSLSRAWTTAIGGRAELYVPAELFAMEFVFVDPASGVVDNNRWVQQGRV